MVFTPFTTVPEAFALLVAMVALPTLLEEELLPVVLLWLTPVVLWLLFCKAAVLDAVGDDASIGVFWGVLVPFMLVVSVGVVLSVLCVVEGDAWVACGGVLGSGVGAVGVDGACGWVGAVGCVGGVGAVGVTCPESVATSSANAAVFLKSNTVRARKINTPFLITLRTRIFIFFKFYFLRFCEGPQLADPQQFRCVIGQEGYSCQIKD